MEAPARAENLGDGFDTVEESSSAAFEGSRAFQLRSTTLGRLGKA